MAETKRDREAELAVLSADELEQRLREAFFYPDQIDETVFRELEELREALEKKRPMEAEYTAEESWARFLEDRADELEGILGPETRPAGGRAAAQPRVRRLPSLLRRTLIAAVIVVLLAGAALAAGPRLWVWVRSWNDAPAQDTPAGGAAAGPIRSALEALEITEPVYPGWMPSNYVLTEAHVSKDPLFLYELYTREDHFISISVAPISAVETEGLPRKGQPPEEYQVGETVHYLFSNSGSITAVWYTEHYFVSVSGSVTIRAMKRIIDSVYGISEWR